MLLSQLIVPELRLPWLEISILTPLIGAVACAAVVDKSRARLIAMLASGFTLLLTLGEWYDFRILQTAVAHDHLDFVRYLFGIDVFVIDELISPLLPLTAILYLLTIISTLPTKMAKMGRYGFSWMMVSLAIACVPVWIELRESGASTRLFTICYGCLDGIAGDRIRDDRSTGRAKGGFDRGQRFDNRGGAAANGDRAITFVVA